MGRLLLLQKIDMPSCDKKLGLYHNNIATHKAMQVRCAKEEGHEGQCSFHLWTDHEPRVQVIHA